MPRFFQDFEKLLGRARIWDWFVDRMLSLVPSVISALLLAGGWFMGARPIVTAGMVFVLAFGITFFTLSQARRFFGIAPKQTETSPPTTNSLYVPAPHLDFRNLQEDLFINTELVFFNGHATEISLVGVSGFMTFMGIVNDHSHVPQVLDTPTFRDVYGRTTFPNGQSIVLLEQRVTRKIADAMSDALASSKSLKFSLSDLNVQVRTESKPTQYLRLPLPNRIECTLCGEKTFSSVTNDAQIRICLLPASKPGQSPHS